MENGMDLPSGCRLSIEANPSWQDREFVDSRLGDYNEAFVSDTRYDYFAIFVRDGASDIRAGLIGNLYDRWLFINLLWVDGEMRGGGIGRGLIAAAESRAIAFDCHSSYVDTFSFQAPGFYRKLGYTAFGTIDYPPRNTRIFLQKRLLPES
jgi:GNAT superfamily N-acetyltransferase